LCAAWRRATVRQARIDSRGVPLVWYTLQLTLPDGEGMTMPKLKTHKGAARRFAITGSGKLMRTKGMKSHLRRKKSARVKRQFDEMIEVNKVDVKRLSKMIPYGA
jgi:large subunit ribosomal protein L35